MHYYQFNIADYRKDTQHLSPIEHYIYRELMDLYYLDEQPIPNKTQWVIRRLRLVSENNQEVINVLEEFFILEDDEWKHKRIDKELSVYQSKAETARINGSKGGRPKKPTKTQPVKNRNPEETQKKANQEPITINQDKEKKKKETFSPPILKEVSDYVSEKDYHFVNPETFMSHYNTNGWKVGKNKMVCWKSAVTGWQTRAKEKSGSSPQQENQPRRAFPV